jgi:phosphoheptose isomerase
MINPAPQFYPYEWTPAGAKSLADLIEFRQQCRAAGRRVVTTNGCFDLLHAGHARFLSDARAMGDALIVGVNSDASVRQLKGVGHPLVAESDRAAMLAALHVVDRVIVFDDLLPSNWLAQVQPDTHCKAADYTVAAMPEAAVVQQYGGQVKILPLLQGRSTSDLIKKAIAATESSDANSAAQLDDRRSQFIAQMLASVNVLRQTAYRASESLVRAADCLGEALDAGGKVLLCGNGGSAADAQHFAAELVGRFRHERDPLPAIALTTDTSILTALGNDYGFDQIFARQIAALGCAGDVLIALSTSGASRNVLAAVDAARAKNLRVIALIGARPSPLAELADVALVAPSEDAAQIQQTHTAMLHLLCDWIERTVGRCNRPTEQVETR